MATANSTLILSLQARNESQAAFAEIRAAMQEQVTQAREASAQQQTAVKASAEQQLLAVKQGLAQQVLAQRQALEQQVAAIRASGTGNVDAQVLAAKQDYEQQVLAAKDAAEQKALAIKTGMAQELDEVRAGLAQQVDAQKIASAEQIAAVRTQATEEVAALRAEAVEGRGAAEGGLLSRLPVVGGLLGGERAEGLLDLGKTVIGFAAATAAITAVVEAIHELPRAFAEAATEGESFQAQMSNFTRSWEDAGKVLEWTNQQALKMPFTLAQIREATASLAEAGIDPSKFLPAAGDIAAAYHTQLTDFVGVAERAIATGSTRGLQSYLHMTKAQLAAVGLEWDKHRKLISSSVEPGLERLAQVKFGGAMLREARTAQGGLQILANQWEIFKEVAGEGLFAGLKNTLANVIDWLNSHQRAVQQFAMAVGQGLGSLLSAAMRVAGWIYTNFGPPILFVVNMVIQAWQAASPAISAAISAIQGAMGGIGAWLQSNVLPGVQTAIGQMTTWWDRHKQDVGTIIGAIQRGINTFWTWLSQSMHDLFLDLHGVWDVGWGFISGVLGLIIDVMSGDWKKFGDDLTNMGKQIATGVLEIFNGMVDDAIRTASRLAGPLSDFINNILTPALRSAAGLMAQLFEVMAIAVETAWDRAYNAMIDKLDKIANNPLMWAAFGLGAEAKVATLALHKVELPSAAEQQRRIAEAGAMVGGGAYQEREYYSAAEIRRRAGEYAAGQVDEFLRLFPGASPEEIADATKRAIAYETQQLAQGYLRTVTTPGLIPKTTIDLRFDTTAAIKATDEWFRHAEKKIQDLPNPFTGKPSGYQTPEEALKKGRKEWDDWAAWLKTHHITLPALPKDWGKGGFPDLTSWGAGGGAAGGTDAVKTLQDNLSAAETHLRADLMKPGVSYATLMADRERIFEALRAEQKAGLKSADDIFIAMHDTFDQIRQHFHQQQAGAVSAAQQIFQTDVTLGKPAQTLMADITRVTNAMKAEGDPGDQIKAARKTMLEQIAKAPGTGKDTVTEAQARLQLLLDKGPVTLAQGLADIKAIAAAERALPAGQRQSDTAITLEVLRNTKDLLGKLLTQADEKLRLDIANHADSKKLLQDEAAYMKLFAMGPGVTKTDIAYQKKQLDDAIAAATGGPATGGPVAPVPRYGALADETGYGQTVVSFGGAQANPWQSMVAALREQITHLRAQLAKDDQLIALLEVGNATGSQQLGVLRSIDGHVIPGPPTPARSAHSALKAAGSYAPVTR